MVYRAFAFMANKVQRRRRRRRNPREGFEDNGETAISIVVTCAEQPEQVQQNVQRHYSCVFRLAKAWAWPSLAQRCRDCPEEAMPSFVDASGDTALHVVLIGNPPAYVVDALLVACPDLAQSKNNRGQTPLAVAASYRCSGPVVRALVKAYPKAASLADFKGSFPLHLACDFGCSVDSFRALLEVHECLSVVDRKDSLFDRTPLQILHERQNLHFLHNQLDELRSLLQSNPHRPELGELVTLVRMTDYWQKVIMLMFVLDGKAPLPPPEDWEPCQWNGMVHACLKTGIGIPDTIAELVVLLHPKELQETNQEGFLPLHVAVKTASLTTVSDMMFSCPSCACVVDPDGHLPIENLLRRRGICLEWELVRHFLLACPSSLDCMVGPSLLPRIVQKFSAGPYQSVSDLFLLIQSNPLLFALSR